MLQTLSLILLGGALFTLYSLLKVAFGPKGPGSVIMVFVLASIAVNLTGYAMELSSTSFAALDFWSKVQYVGLSYYPSLFFLFVYRYTVRSGSKLKLLMTAVLIFSTISLVLRLTNRLHGLYFREVSIDTAGSFPTLALENGIWANILVIYTNLLLIISLYQLIRYHSRVLKTYFARSVLIIAAIVMPWAAFILYEAGSIPNSIDPIPFVLIPSAVIFHICITKFHLFSISPIARDVLFEHLEEGIAVFDNRRTLIDYNLAVTRIFPAVTDRKLGRPVNEVFPLYPELQDMVRGEAGASRYELVLAERGEELTYQAISYPIRIRNAERGIIVIFRNISDRIQLIRQLEDLSVSDPLTGTINRRRIDGYLESEWRRAKRYHRPMAIILYDIDQFKRVNDVYGKSFGDVVLKDSAREVSGALRGTDLHGRFGGDEFIIILPETTLAAAAELAERLRVLIASLRFAVSESSRQPQRTRTAAVSSVKARAASDAGMKRIEHAGPRAAGDMAYFGVKASFGVAEFTHESISFHDLFDHAEQALHSARQAGGNLVKVFVPDVGSVDSVPSDIMDYD